MVERLAKDITLGEVILDELCADLGLEKLFLIVNLLNLSDSFGKNYLFEDYVKSRIDYWTRADMTTQSKVLDELTHKIISRQEERYKDLMISLNKARREN